MSLKAELEAYDSVSNVKVWNDTHKGRSSVFAHFWFTHDDEKYDCEFSVAVDLKMSHEEMADLMVSNARKRAVSIESGLDYEVEV